MISGRAVGSTLTSMTHPLLRSATASELSASIFARGLDATASGSAIARSRFDAPGTHDAVGNDPNTSTATPGLSVCTTAATCRTRRSTARRSARRTAPAGENGCTCASSSISRPRRRASRFRASAVRPGAPSAPVADFSGGDDINRGGGGGGANGRAGASAPRETACACAWWCAARAACGKEDGGGGGADGGRGADGGGGAPSFALVFAPSTTA
eukprot:3289-Pelagococcus_subviridis.AAC.1